LENIPIDKFKALSKNEQYDIVHYFGIFLSQYHKGEYLVALYQLHSFYVEVVFKSHTLIVLKCFESLKELDKFLNQIDISELGLSVRN
jgi:hypothetical protein